ncbi:MAG: Flavobacterium phage vB FspS morran9, partial [Bacteroidota bacterium]
MSKWSIYDNDLLESLQKNKEINQSELAKSIFRKYNLEFTSNETEALAKYINRNRKRFLDEYEGTYDATNSLDVDNTSVKHMWIKNKEASLFVKNPNYIEQELTKISDLKSDLIKDLQEYSPKFVKLERVENKESYLLIIDPADIHIG